jgi:cardiolipin synthase
MIGLFNSRHITGCRNARRFIAHSAVREWIFAIMLWAALSIITGCGPSMRTTYYYEPAYGVDSLEFARSMEGLGSRMRPFNTAKLLNNGDEFFPAIIDAIRSAEHSINIELYIYADGEIGATFSQILSEKALQGVNVRVLVDAVGARMGKLEDEMQAAGVQVKVFKPIKLYSIHKIDDRTHRKIFTIDGKIGFIGGLAIDDRWMGSARTPDEWREMVVKLEGPVVSQLQRIFMQDWLHTTGEVLHGDGEFPSIPYAGDTAAQIISSSRSDQSSMAKLHYLSAIKAARNRIWIENAYFVPDYDFIVSLIAAAERGVDVRIVVPGELTDFKALRRASQANYTKLLKGGVKIYEFQPSMLHSKVMVADGIFVSIGSINFVSRSMKKNAEANAVVYDRQFASKVEASIKEDIARSKEITLEAWSKRGLNQRIKEQYYSIYSNLF